jgi:H+/Cl- antiporter ClcA
MIADEVDTATDALLTASRALVAVAARSLAGIDDVTLPQFRALVILTRPTTVTVGDLAGALDVHPSTATRLCDRLERKRLIRRRPGAAPDRRETTVDLTAAGRRLVARVTDRRRRDLAAIAAAMTSQDRQVAISGLPGPPVSSRSSIPSGGPTPHRRRGRRPMVELLTRLKDWPYLRKWLVLGALIGVVAGLGAIVFIFALEGSSKLLLETLGGYKPPLPIGEGNRLAAGSFARPWAVPLVVGLGGLISGVLVFRFAPEAQGHGTDAAIAAVHHNPRGIRARVTLIKLASSAATIGSGGSAGREGPTAQISAGFGSLLARRLELSPQDARIAVAVGVGSGIGAIFRAPLGGAVLGTEILYRDDLEPEALFPSLVASIVGFSTFGAVEGFEPIFGNLHTTQFDHPVQLVYYALLGIAAGLVGRLYARAFYGMVRLRHRLPGPEMLKPAAAGVAVGLLGLAFPAALATGYGWLQRGMRDGLPDMALWVVLALPLVKILATSLSIGSGGSGGIFGPGMVIGGFLGLGVWRVLHGVAGGMPDLAAPFMVVGMIACFGSVAHAPLGLMLMVAEMTGSLALLPPAMVAIGLAALVVGEDSIYESQLRSRADAPAHRAAFGLPLLSSVMVADVMTPPRVTVTATMPLDDARGLLEDLRVPGAPVLGDDGRFVGVLALGQTELPGAPGAGDIDRSYPTVPSNRGLDFALDAMVSGGIGWIPVVDGGRLVGIVAMNEVIGGYQRALRRSLRLLADVRGSAVLVEAPVSEASPFAGATVATAPWPRGSFALSIDRRSQLITPTPETVLEAGDVVVAVVPAAAESELRQRLDGATPP